MFSNFFLKSFRLLLFPFSLLYWLGIWIRSWLYDKGIFRSSSFGLPIICVGNLSVGGTGKTPMVEYLVTILKSRFKTATVSRGYKRKTRGYALARPGITALEIGDEPMQFFLKFPDLAIAVGEERLVAIPQLLHDRPETEVIILDDAFQHRAIRAGLNILLTEEKNLFTRDFYLPTGDLRDLKSNAKRADMILVTKCNEDLSEAERNRITRELNPLPEQSIFFTSLSYGSLYHITEHTEHSLQKDEEVLLVTGIANPEPLKQLLSSQCQSYQLMSYPDHHVFSIDDLQDITKKFRQLPSKRKVILTTEKDAVRLNKFYNEISSLPFYVIPVKHRFLFDDAPRFESLIISFILQFKNVS